MNYEDISEIEGFKKIPLGKAKNYCGQKFGKLTVLYRTEAEGTITRWVCKCDCGNIVNRCINGIRRDDASCGCMNNENARKQALNSLNYHNTLDYSNIKEIEGFKKLPLGRSENLYGKKFNRLAPLYRTQPLTNSQRCAFWLCKCDCGNYYVTRASSMLNGSTQSCGCYNSDATSERTFHDITGQRFGKLVAIKLTSKKSPNIKSKSRYWLCQCDCGKQTVVSYSCLVTGKTISCGCAQKEIVKENNKKLIKDLTGKIFGYLTVIKQDNNPNLKGVYWICKCKCGNIVSVRARSLSSNRTLSCGCFGSSKGEVLINDILSQNNISFKKEVSNETLQYKRKLRFDFGIYEHNKIKYFIEYDGIQHFKQSGGWHTKEGVAFTQFKDQLKNQWCKDNNIPLIRIPYTAYNTLSIEDLKLETTQYRVV